ncbi:MAG: FxLYD domain-containing protein [Thermoproteota archaeon]|nr:FxLYD domain-containing protein [Thermoproteota archaeon]
MTTTLTVTVTTALMILLSSPLPSMAQQQQQQSIDSDIAITIVSHSLIDAGSGITIIVGEVRNDSPEKIGWVQVSGKFYDSAGQLIHLAEGPVQLGELRPGEKGPFGIYINDAAVSEGIANYTLSAGLDSDFLQDKPAALKVVLDKHGMVVSGIGLPLYQVTGNVTNTGNLPAESVDVIATFYDAAGNFVDFDATVTSPSTIPAGQSADFTIVTLVGDYGNWTAEIQRITSVNATAESSEYLAIMVP